MNLYKVTCRKAGFEAYVVSRDATAAYETYKKVLDDNDFGFKVDRTLDKIEFLAEEDGSVVECRGLFVEEEV